MDANGEMVHSEVSVTASTDGADGGESADPSDGALSSSIHGDISDSLLILISFWCRFNVPIVQFNSG